MLALVVIDTCCVALLAVLVAGLLRSHADILRALHQLGAGVGDPAQGGRAETAPVAGNGATAPVTMGPALSPGRHSTAVHDVAGVSPRGDALSVSATAGTGRTLLVFLSSGCTSCAGIWRALEGGGSSLPVGLRVVVVTKGPELESPEAVRRQAPPGVTVVMSSTAWGDYEVPGSPFFVLLDASAGRRVGEGMANHLSQVVDLVERADGDGADAGGPVERGRLGGPQREAHNDELLRRAGVLPGDPSLYPRRVEDVFSGHSGGDGPDTSVAGRPVPGLH